MEHRERDMSEERRKAVLEQRMKVEKKANMATMGVAFIVLIILYLFFAL